MHGEDKENKEIEEGEVKIVYSNANIDNKKERKGMERVVEETI